MPQEAEQAVLGLSDYFVGELEKLKAAASEFQEFMRGKESFANQEEVRDFYAHLFSMSRMSTLVMKEAHELVSYPTPTWEAERRGLYDARSRVLQDFKRTLQEFNRQNGLTLAMPDEGFEELFRVFHNFLYYFCKMFVDENGLPVEPSDTLWRKRQKKAGVKHERVRQQP